MDKVAILNQIKSGGGSMLANVISSDATDKLAT